MQNSAPQPSPQSPRSASTQTDSTGMSLAELSQAFAAMLGPGDSAVIAVSGDEITESSTACRTESKTVDNVADRPSAKTNCQGSNKLPSTDVANSPADGSGSVTHSGILEAVLFVGRPDNLPLSSLQIAGLMRGVTNEEIDQLIIDLNAQYAANHCPYKIAAEGSGYRFVLCGEHDALRDRFYGRIRAARLSPAAVEVLALIAYREPLTADEIARMRGVPSGHILRQLVRRQLLRLEHTQSKPRKSKYFTTRRFLEIFGLTSLNDLPRSDEVGRE